ncbi:hypothetical protein CSUB01_12012 [Colletotrichum sublineola]|uniref:Uncharacterized protein n=1 Tax=Colletotrichum sublineola TaxID=1173701 RepID=A0A066XQS5_COLSU|nr:hypothetical protein CSUB01_12012 [Colletotrichum sublineola]
MPKQWSGNWSTIASVSSSSDVTNYDPEPETNAMYGILQSEVENFEEASKVFKENVGRPLLAKNRAIIAVCSIHRTPSRVIVATDATLENALDNIAGYDECQELVIVVSGHFDSIEFHVPRHIRMLMVLRCGFGSNINGQLCISGDSTFGNTELQEWQYKQHKGMLFLGRSVGISIDPAGEQWTNASQSFRRDFTESEKRRLERQFDKMRNKTVHGEWWQEWRGRVASIMGILSGGAKLVGSIQASTGGAFFHLPYGMFSLKAGAAYAEGAVIASATVPAILVGVGVAAAVYFMPWEKLFGWFKELAVRF